MANGCTATAAGKSRRFIAVLRQRRFAYNAATMDNQTLTIAAFQQHIHDRYYATDKARGTPGTIMWLIEEIGELATALHQAAGESDNTPGPQDLEQEFADVLAWLCTLANINEIDLADAVRNKYLTDGGPEGHK